MWRNITPRRGLPVEYMEPTQEERWKRYVWTAQTHDAVGKDASRTHYVVCIVLMPLELFCRIPLRSSGKLDKQDKDLGCHARRQEIAVLGIMVDEPQAGTTR
jgi:hypothetical protein